MRATLLAVVIVLAAAPARAGAQPEDAYAIGPGDVLRVTVLGQAEMSGEFPVDPDGRLSFPILGKLQAAGMSAQELERSLSAQLADGYLKKPQVSVSVHEYKSRRVFVTGEVQKPGPYPLKADRTLRALLAEVGALTSSGGHEVVVIRPSPAGAGAFPATVPPEGVDPAGAGDGAQVFRVSLRQLQAGGPDANLQLEAGDTVYFPRAAQLYISGHVARPGPYRFQEGTTVLQALTLAGGITERGSNKRIKIVRTVDGRRTELRARLSDPVQPEDTIVVPERFF
jgi:polysaccharide export outer membrane protein